MKNKHKAKPKHKPKPRKKSVHLQAYPGVRSARLYPSKGEHVQIQITRKYGKRTTAQEKKRAKRVQKKRRKRKK